MLKQPLYLREHFRIKHVPGLGVLNFKNPEFITVEPKTGNLVIADAGNNRICYLSPDGTPIRYLLENLSSPNGVAFDHNGNLVVANSRRDCIHIYDPQGQ